MFRKTKLARGTVKLTFLGVALFASGAWSGDMDIIVVVLVTSDMVNGAVSELRIDLRRFLVGDERVDQH
jgi:hypothetical protein